MVVDAIHNPDFMTMAKYGRKAAHRDVLKEGMLPEEQVKDFLQFTLVAIYEAFTPLIFLAGWRECFYIDITILIR